MASTYEVDISLSPATVDALKSSGFSLYAFKAVKSAVAGGAPLVWFRTNSFLSSTIVTWEEQYQAYISTTQISENVTILANAMAATDLDQIAHVSQNGNITTSTGGAKGAISILNEGTERWTTGISQVANGKANPMCAIPLYGKTLDVIVPIQKVLLTFASTPVNTGTVIYKAFSESVMVDLTAARKRAVHFDIDGGWSWDEGTWAKTVAANADLVPLLITN